LNTPTSSFSSNLDSRHKSSNSSITNTSSLSRSNFNNNTRTSSTSHSMNSASLSSVNANKTGSMCFSNSKNSFNPPNSLQNKSSHIPTCVSSGNQKNGITSAFPKTLNSRNQYSVTGSSTSAALNSFSGNLPSNKNSSYHKTTSITDRAASTAHPYKSNSTPAKSNIKPSSSTNKLSGLMNMKTSSNVEKSAAASIDLNSDDFEDDDMFLELIEQEDLILNSQMESESLKPVQENKKSQFPVSKTVGSSNMKSCVKKSNCIEQTNDQLIRQTHNFISPVKSVKQGFDSSTRIQAASPMAAFFKKTHGDQVIATGKQNSLPVKSSTPLKGSKRITGSERCTETKQSRNNSLGSSFDFDDSFMNDEALFESQILPLLEKAETEALNVQSTINPGISSMDGPSSQPQCSPDEIEQKRLAALQRRSQRLKR